LGQAAFLSKRTHSGAIDFDDVVTTTWMDHQLASR
jgi:hypothetical protein